MKRFLVLWTGQFISAIGGGLTSFGLLVYVFQKTGSAAGMALVTWISADSFVKCTGRCIG